MTWPAWVSLAATVVNALAVVVLVFVTWAYAKAAQRQAEAAKMQADAAKLQAAAAQAQGNAALQTLSALRQQVFDQYSLAFATVEGTVKSALANVDFWQTLVKSGFALALQSKSLPTTVILVPGDASEGLAFARRLSKSLGEKLTAAFDKLNAARQKIEAAKGLDRRYETYFDFGKETQQIDSLLTTAKAALQECQTDLYTIPRADNPLAS